MVEFRRSLAASFLFRFVLHVNYALEVRMLQGYVVCRGVLGQNLMLASSSTCSLRPSSFLAG